MADELIRAVAALTRRLVALAERDEGLRDDLRTLAGAVLAATERSVSPDARALEPGAVEVPTEARAESISLLVSEPVPVPPAPAIEIEAPAPPVSVAAAEVPPRARVPLPELTLGRSRPPEPVPEIHPEPAYTPARGATTDTDLPAVEARCRLKAEGARWAATRQRRLREGAEFRVEIAPRDREILDRARDLECFLWMNSPEFTIPREPAPMEDVAGCFETVADALALARGMLPDVEGNREFFEQALDLLAEAQSALRAAISRIDGPNDPDQYKVYDWLRAVTARERIYIPRHMRLDDPADPARISGVDDRIEALDTRLQEVRQRARRRRSQLSRLRYHAKLIGEGTGREHDWRRVAESIDELVGDGLPASNVEVREVLLPILDALPDLDNLPPGFGRVLREIDGYLAGRMNAPESGVADRPTAEVAETARLLAGKTVVLIGGSRRPDAHEALRSAFGLNDLIWVETREHESIDRCEPYVARPEVALVLLAIRWTSHSFGEVKVFCDRYGKPMVRLPGGYNPNQVAAQVLAQCSGQLGGD